jgi:hypothetical protein
LSGAADYLHFFRNFLSANNLLYSRIFS